MPQPDVATVFDNLAESYDSVGVEFFRPIAARLVEELDPRPGERALDIGCGRGALLSPLATAVGPAGTVTGIDISGEMVRRAVADAAAAGLSVDVRVSDAQAPQLPTASYDVIASSLVLFFLPDPVAALRAGRELLVDGGRIGVSTFGPVTESWRAVDEVLAAFLPEQARDARTTGERGPFASDAGMEQMLRDGGFADVRTVTATFPVRFDDAEHWHRWSMSVAQRAMWEAIPEQRRPLVRAEVYDLVNRQRRDDGRLGFDQQVRFTLARR